MSRMVNGGRHTWGDFIHMVGTWGCACELACMGSQVHAHGLAHVGYQICEQMY
jgi:hypothetical protein